MEDIIEDMDFETEQQDNKIKISEIKKGLPDCKVIEEMNRLRWNRTSIKRKSDRIMDRISNSLNNHKYKKKTKNNKT